MDILKKYNERIYVSSILCDLSYNFYSSIYNFSLLPTILGSSILTIINTSEINDNILKIINISVNGLNTLILALINNYKINDRITLFKNHKIKFTKLNHTCESLINKNEEISSIILDGIITEYDRLQEELVYQYPDYIRKKIIRKFGNKYTLPNSLEVDNSIIKVDFINQVQQV